MQLTWEKIGRYFPKPNLVDNRAYACRDDEGFEFEAIYRFGGGEFWWIAPQTGRETRVTEFCRFRNSC